VRIILIVSGVVTLAVLLLIAARHKDPITVPTKPDGTRSQLSKTVANSSVHSSANSEVALEQNKHARKTPRTVGRERPAELREKTSQDTINTELLEQVRALRAEVAELRRRRARTGSRSRRPTVETQPALDPQTETDHNPNIPGIQQEDEPLGRPVDGDLQNTIHPGTPKDTIAEDEAFKRESQRLTRSAESE
jgi:hypothetical protein